MSILVSPDSFLAKLSFQELQHLRAYIKRVHMKGWPMEKRTDREADKMIEAFGPVAHETALKKAVDAKWSR